MDIQNRRALRAAAAEALDANPGQPRNVVLAYVAIMALSNLLVAVVVDILGSRISQTGGLADMGTRAILSTIQTCLPIAQVVAMWYIQLGYQKSTVAMARRKAVEPRDLMEGFRFFGPLLRAILLQGLVYMLLGFLTVQVSSVIFMMTPFSNDFIALVGPLVTDMDAFYNALYTDAQLYTQVGMTLLPMIPICLAMLCVTVLPFFLSCRMVNYILVEQPGTGALRAISESARMMKGSRMTLLKYDLGFWWFYLAQFLLTALLYGDVLLPRMGVVLPWNATIAYYLFSALYFILTGLLFWAFLNRVEVTYATFYDALRPRPQEQSGGAVLGNIFDLARKYREE